MQWQLHPSCFFRPEAEPARQLGVLAARFLRAERGGFLSVLELFAGSGLRAARYLVEGGADFVWANEANQEVYQALVANVAGVGNGNGFQGPTGCDDLLPEWAAPARWCCARLAPAGNCRQRFGLGGPWMARDALGGESFVGLLYSDSSAIRPGGCRCLRF